MITLVFLDKTGPRECPLTFSELLSWYLGKGIFVHHVSTTLNVKLLTFTDVHNTTQNVIRKPRYICYSFLAAFG